MLSGRTQSWSFVDVGSFAARPTTILNDISISRANFKLKILRPSDKNAREFEIQ
jgi:hypothetical protein